jgi:NADPH-dependent 2,4-dienoyl-CoA reductase/sulfur reductase-like enzyme
MLSKRVSGIVALLLLVSGAHVCTSLSSSETACAGSDETAYADVDGHGAACFAAASTVAKPRIAVVGGGIAGASTLRFLRTLLGDSVEFVLYERRHELGGRVRVVDTPHGGVLEVGASVYHISNRYVRSFISELGLEEQG